MRLVRIVAPCLLAVALVAPAAPAPAAAGELLTFSKREGSVSLLTVGDRQTKLPGAPPAFRAFARASMRTVWKGQFGGRPACKTVPRLQVRALRTDGFALGYVRYRGQPRCPAGGGSVAFWATRQGQWTLLMSVQDVPPCHRLERVGFPSELGVSECFDGKDVVPYSHA